MRLLIVEDDKALASGLKSVLEREGYQVDVVYDGNSGCDYLESGIYDLAILDVNLPGKDGFRVMEYSKNNNIETPVIFLTARTDVEDRVQGLSSGAVDYITKPFDVRELSARIKLRIPGGGNPGMVAQEGKLTIGNTSLKAGNLSLNCAGKQILLSKKEYYIVEQLMLNEGVIQGRDSLITKVWGIDKDVDYRTLDVYISMLRKKLAYLGSTAEIVTKRSMGYYIREGEADDI